MFSILKRKDYLIDHLKGITDIHNHILPGLDDGATGIEDSISLLKKYKALGIKNFIATPHVMNEFYPNTPETIHGALEKLKNCISINEDLKEIKIRAAAEYMMDQYFLDILENEKLLVLKDNYVLTEMSYFQAPINLNEILFQLQTKGYKPVLAHPERYAYYHSKDLRKYEELKNRGCKFQMNVLSLTPHYGSSMQKTAFSLLENGMIDFIGTDTHRLQHLQKLETIKIHNKILSPITKVIETTKEYF